MIALRRQDAEADTDIACVLSQHACEPLDSEIERIESILASRLLASRAAGGACMNPQQPPAALNPCNKSRRLTVSYAQHRYAGRERALPAPLRALAARAGFVIGRHVKIEGREGRMTIEQVD